MRYLISVAAALALSSAAGSVSAQGADWSGLYGGLSMATHDGGNYYDGSDTVTYDLEGPAFGAFIGYNWGNGPLVYGAELAASKGGVYEVEPDGGTSYKDEYEYTRFLDLKGRVGYTFHNVLLYGTLGVSRASFLSDETVTIDTTGTVFGLGADYQFGGRYFVGAEYLRRQYDFYDFNQGSDIEGDINTFTLRGGFRF
ncbi:outer membrane protein [Tabrizicola sp. YIM 78059]|uniref:outer membrane protein n=1 Tax=Tabrizicola sp. YIM 78059 TaxID=2529861 RepID=UPI00145A7D5E|nr:outer membrane beta-barrel protein [Tabrizicola sp. YIM 78059]